jgi:hypothetical protein
MRIGLETTGRRLAVAGLALVIAVPYGAWVVNHVRASGWGESLHTAGLEKAAALEPDNAEHAYRLGRFYLLAEQDYPRAIESLRRATRLNPHISWYWLDLSTAYAIQGDSAAQREALQRASEADPRTPQVAWEIGNLLLTDGKTEEALRYFRTAISNDPSRARQGLEICWRATGDIGRVLREAVPPEVMAHLALLQTLTRLSDPAPARETWKHLLALQQPIPAQAGAIYPEYLMQAGEPAEARDAWDSLAASNPEIALTARADEAPMVNPGFEEEPVSGGFSWRITPPPGVEVAIRDDEFHSGSRSLRLTFRGPGFQQAGVSQYVLVEPGEDYELSYWAKAAELRSLSGPQFWVQDAYSHAVLGTGQAWIGTNVWREERIGFRTPPGTRLVAIRLVRTRPEQPISGRMWLDDFRVVKK